MMKRALADMSLTLAALDYAVKQSPIGRVMAAGESGGRGCFGAQ